MKEQEEESGAADEVVGDVDVVHTAKKMFGKTEATAENEGLGKEGQANKARDLTQ